MPIRVPVIDLAEVSAGGGSIAWIDPGGALKVGPHSAGAVPGPASYGRGGTLPTVTDANVILGYLDPVALLDGALPIDRAAAERVIVQHVGTPLGLSVVDAAARIIEIVTANMAQALRIVSIERGHDPAAFSLIAFGGAGPIHAAALAAELGIPEVVVPPAPGAFSALGLVATDLKRDYARTLYAPLDGLDPARVAAAIGAMADAGTAMLDAARVPAAQRALPRAADLRYRRQAYELTVPLADGPITADTLAALAAEFHRRHEQTYGHANPSEPVQLVNLRLTALGRLPGITLTQSARADAAREGARDAWFGNGLQRCRVVWRAGLAPGAVLDGPTIVEALDSTTVVPPGWRATVDPQGFLRMRRR